MFNISDFVGNSLSKILLKYLQKHEPEVQAAIIVVATKFINDLGEQITKELNEQLAKMEGQIPPALAPGEPHV